MIKRGITESIKKSLSVFPAVGLIGSRQVGKTTLAKGGHGFKKAVYLDLENPEDQFKLSRPDIYLQKLTDQLVIIDEVQLMPELFPLLRSLIDQKRTPGRFLLLGSASPALIRQSSESLAGRIIYHELSPLDLREVKTTKLDTLWMRGGYPESFLAKNDKMSFLWRESFIRSFLERDIPQFGLRIPAPQLRRFWTMLAHLHGQIWNASQIAVNFGISATSIQHYLDILEETFMVRRLHPYFENTKKRLIKSPKVYVRDSGLLHSLLSISSPDALQSNPILGVSWEGFVLEQIIRQVPLTWQYFFYRTSTGNEIDLILKDDHGKYTSIEVKYSLHPQLTKGFWGAIEDLKCSRNFVIYPGDSCFPVGKNLEVLSIKNLSRIFNR